MLTGCDPADMWGGKAPTVQRSLCGCVTLSGLGNKGRQAGLTVSLDHGPNGDVATSLLCKNRDQTWAGRGSRGDTRQEEDISLPWETLKAAGCKDGTCP